jgi:hypothetical protein
MARVHTITRCLKPLTCGRCGETIKKGEGYRYAQPGFRNRHKSIRCMSAKCSFRASELTSSKMSQVYAAVENAEDEIASWDGEDAEDLAEVLRNAAEEIRTVSEEYGEAAEAMQGAGEEMQEKADELESWAGDIESAADDLPEQPEDEDPDNVDAAVLAKRVADRAAAEAKGEKVPSAEEAAEEAEAAHAEALEEWRQAVRDAASEPLGNCPV